MKRYLFSLIACVLLISMVFTACQKPDSDDLGGEGSQTESESQSERESEAIPEGPYTAQERYMPDAVASEVKTIFEEGGTYGALSATYAPYAIRDIYTLSGVTLTSISIPVYQTKSADAEGNFTLTLYITETSYEGLRTIPKNDVSYVLKVNGAQYGLAENQSKVCRYVTVDVSSYHIVLAENESLAIFAPTDTLIPAIITEDSSHDMENLFYDEFPEILCSFNRVGSASAAPSLETLFFDFAWERTYESYDSYQSALNEEATYEEMVQVIGEKYKDGYLSVLGDSISTFKGVSNDPKANSTISKDREWYYPHATNANIYYMNETYWGRFLEDTGISLAVNNSWSGSRVYGRVGYADNMLLRSTQLHQDKTGGAEPSLIFVYMGVNDMRNQNQIVFGDLYEILRKKDGRSDKEKIDAWFEAVLANTDLTGEIKQGVTYESFEQAYALSLHSMKERYADADIYCFTVMQHYDTLYGTYPNYNDAAAAAETEKFNRCIRALAEYFEVGVIDQDTGDFCFETAHAYTNDREALHPNLMGHKKMTELIVKTIYEDITKG